MLEKLGDGVGRGVAASASGECLHVTVNSITTAATATSPATRSLRFIPNLLGPCAATPWRPLPLETRDPILAFDWVP